MTRFDNYNDYSYSVIKWTGWETHGLENIMRIAYEFQLSQDGYPYDYRHYRNDCLDMKTEALNELLECRRYENVKAGKTHLFLGRYSLQEYREDNTE